MQRPWGRMQPVLEEQWGGWVAASGRMDYVGSNFSPASWQCFRTEHPFSCVKIGEKVLGLQDSL